MRSLHIAAVLTWAYAAGFGIPAVPVALYLLDRGRLPIFLNMFEMYGGPWSSRGMRAERFALLLVAFFVLTVGSAVAAWYVWHASRAGAVACLVLLAVEAVFWVGFALPIPWILALATVGFLASGWSMLH